MPEARKIIFNIKNNMRAPTPSSDSKPNRTAPRKGPGSIEAQIGLLVIFGILAAFILLEVAGSLSPFADTMEFQARFANIKDLREGDPVKMAGMTIGQVGSMTLDEGMVRVTLAIDEKHHASVRTDSEAAIQFEGLMGQHYVSLSFGKQGLTAESGAMLPAVEQPDLNRLMSKLESVAEGVQNLTSSFSGDSFNTVLQPLGDLIEQNKDKVSGILSHLESISGKVASGEGTIGKLVQEQTLYESALAAVEQLEKAGNDIQVTAEQAKEVVGRLKEGQGTLGKLSVDPTLYDETTQAMTQLREILVKLNDGKGSLGRIINDPALLNNATTTLQKINKATESIEDQGPMSVIGMTIGNLF